VLTDGIIQSMARRKTRNTRASLDAVEKLERLKKSTGKTSADILDEALEAYFDKFVYHKADSKDEDTNRFQQSIQTVFDRLKTTKGKLDKDDPVVRSAIKVGDELGIDWSISPTVEPSIKFDDMDDFHNFFNKLREEHRVEFKKDIHRNPRYVAVDNTKPPNAFIDSAILSLWGKESIEALNAITNPDYEDFLRPRGDIIRRVKYHVEKPIDGTSWAELHKAWFKSYGKYKGKFEVTVDNRIKSLMWNKIIKPSLGEGYSIYDGKRGYYILYRDLTDNENKIIEGILSLKPQRGIVIPKII